MALSNGKVPPAEAFALYVGLGESRSYTAICQKYGVSKRAVVALAQRHHWPERLREIEEEAARRLRESQVVSIVEARERHLKALKIMQAKALTGLREKSVRSVGEAARTLEAAIKLERLILGESTSNTNVSVEERQQREVDQLLVDDEDEDGAGDECEGDEDRT